jgi:hypothetical protein
MIVTNIYYIKAQALPLFLQSVLILFYVEIIDGSRAESLEVRKRFLWFSRHYTLDL